MLFTKLRRNYVYLFFSMSIDFFLLPSPIYEFFLTMNGSWILSNAFFALINKYGHVFFFFSLLLRWITLIGYQILSKFLYLLKSFTWSWCMILFRYCWILFANIFLIIFAFIFIHSFWGFPGSWYDTWFFYWNLDIFILII